MERAGIYTPSPRLSRSIDRVFSELKLYLPRTKVTHQRKTMQRKRARLSGCRGDRDSFENSIFSTHPNANWLCCLCGAHTMCSPPVERRSVQIRNLYTIVLQSIDKTAQQDSGRKAAGRAAVARRKTISYYSLPVGIIIFRKRTTFYDGFLLLIDVLQIRPACLQR